MTTYFQINGLLKFAERDHYDNGCDPKSGCTFMVDVTFKGDSPEEVIRKTAEYLDKEDGIELDSCGEIGRVDFAGMEKGDSTRPTLREIREWKLSRRNLWYVVYTGYVEKVTVGDIALSGLVINP